MIYKKKLANYLLILLSIKQNVSELLDALSIVAAEGYAKIKLQIFVHVSMLLEL